MADQAHAVSDEFQIAPVRRGVHQLFGRNEYVTAARAPTDRFSRSLLNRVDGGEQVLQFGIRLV